MFPVMLRGTARGISRFGVLEDGVDKLQRVILDNAQGLLTCLANCGFRNCQHEQAVGATLVKTKCLEATRRRGVSYTERHFLTRKEALDHCQAHDGACHEVERGIKKVVA